MISCFQDTYYGYVKGYQARVPLSYIPPVLYRQRSFMTTIRQLLVGPGCLELTSKPDGSPVTAAAVGLRISDLTTASSDPG